jgi:site-specific DNA recombinase
MLSDAEAGQFDVLIVHKMDRFARRLRLALECLERLGRARVGVVSVSEPNLDYSTPQGFLFLSMLGALAEWYSRNLSAEVKKGYAERKRRGLYGGRIPFGAVKGEDGVPMPDTQLLELDGRATSNYEGLQMAFDRAAEGATDADVAEMLNNAGYRPQSHARRARFTRDSVRAMLASRFYVSELPIGKRGKDGWVQAAHRTFVPLELFEAVQRHRERRTRRANSYSVNRGARVHAFSGLVRCAECGESMHQEGRQRLYCWGRRQRVGGCRAPSASLREVEQELGNYLRTLRLPEDTKQRILAVYADAQPEFQERARKRRTLESQLQRLGDLFVLGDLPKSEYETRRATLRAELALFAEADGHGHPEVLGRLEKYLLNAADAWDAADAAQRNKLARALLESIMIRDGHIAAVHPRPEFQPYFVLAESDTLANNGRGCASESGRDR